MEWLHQNPVALLTATYLGLALLSFGIAIWKAYRLRRVLNAWTIGFAIVSVLLVQLPRVALDAANR